jgi:two-component system sensor histidine kinase UhpB
MWLEGNAIELEIVDDGKGIAHRGDAADSLGLVGMRERAALVGGSIQVADGPERGTVVRVKVPLRT